MPHSNNKNFTKPPETVVVDGMLFDMDGTIIDSTKAITKHWEELGKRIGVDPHTILETSHGRRSIDTLEKLAPELANWDFVRDIEREIPKKWGQDAILISGSKELLERLGKEGAPWMIVTSATTPLLEGWLKVMQMKHPTDVVTAEDVSAGKPDPMCYLLGRKKLGLSEEATCLVVEDAPSGIRAGKSAGFKVVAVATTHRVDQLQEAGADWIVKDLTSIVLTSFDDQNSGKITLLIKDALVAE